MRIASGRPHFWQFVIPKIARYHRESRPGGLIRPEIELPYLKDPEGFSLAVSLEPYLFLSASRLSNPVLSPML